MSEEAWRKSLNERIWTKITIHSKLPCSSLLELQYKQAKLITFFSLIRYNTARLLASVRLWSSRRYTVLDLWMGIHTAWWWWETTAVLSNKFTSAASLMKSHMMTVRAKRTNIWYPFSLSVHSPDTLKEAPVPIISTKKCNSSCMYNGEITTRMLCAGYTEGKVDACQVRCTFWTQPLRRRFKDLSSFLWFAHNETLACGKLGQCVMNRVCVYLYRGIVGALWFARTKMCGGW